MKKQNKYNGPGKTPDKQTGLSKTDIAKKISNVETLEHVMIVMQHKVAKLDSAFEFLMEEFPDVRYKILEHFKTNFDLRGVIEINEYNVEVA